MGRIRYIVRGSLFLPIILLIFYVNNRTDVSIGQITKFKLETFNKVNTDSLDAEHKLDMLVDETKKFSGKISEESSDVKEGINYLILLVVTWILVEGGFFVADRRKADG